MVVVMGRPMGQPAKVDIQLTHTHNFTEEQRERMATTWNPYGESWARIYGPSLARKIAYCALCGKQTTQQQVAPDGEPFWHCMDPDHPWLDVRKIAPLAGETFKPGQTVTLHNGSEDKTYQHWPVEKSLNPYLTDQARREMKEAMETRALNLMEIATARGVPAEAFQRRPSPGERTWRAANYRAFVYGFLMRSATGQMRIPGGHLVWKTCKACAALKMTKTTVYELQHNALCTRYIYDCRECGHNETTPVTARRTPPFVPRLHSNAMGFIWKEGEDVRKMTDKPHECPECGLYVPAGLGHVCLKVPKREWARRANEDLARVIAQGTMTRQGSLVERFFDGGLTTKLNQELLNGRKARKDEEIMADHISKMLMPDEAKAREAELRFICAQPDWRPIVLLYLLQKLEISAEDLGFEYPPDED
jgi:hypothetical protein